MATVAVIALGGAFAAGVGGHVGWGILASAFLVFAVASFLFPTRYVLSAEGVEVRILGARRKRAWSDLHLVSDSRDGILLSPSRRAGLLDPVRTLFLRYADNAEEVRGFVRERLDA